MDKPIETSLNRLIDLLSRRLPARQQADSTQKTKEVVAAYKVVKRHEQAEQRAGDAYRASVGKEKRARREAAADMTRARADAAQVATQGRADTRLAFADEKATIQKYQNNYKSKQAVVDTLGRQAHDADRMENRAKREVQLAQARMNRAARAVRMATPPPGKVAGPAQQALLQQRRAAYMQERHRWNQAVKNQPAVVLAAKKQRDAANRKMPAAQAAVARASQQLADGTAAAKKRTASQVGQINARNKRAQQKIATTQKRGVRRVARARLNRIARGQAYRGAQAATAGARTALKAAITASGAVGVGLGRLVPVVGQVIAGFQALKAITLDVGKEFRNSAEQQFARNAHFAHYNGAIGLAYGQVAMGDFSRNMQMARETKETTVNLAKSVNRMRDNWLKYDIATNNLQNRFENVKANISGFIGDKVGWVADKLDKAAGMIERAVAGPGADEKAMANQVAMNQAVAGAVAGAVGGGGAGNMLAAVANFEAMRRQMGDLQAGPADAFAMALAKQMGMAGPLRGNVGFGDPWNRNDPWPRK